MCGRVVEEEDGEGRRREGRGVQLLLGTFIRLIDLLVYLELWKRWKAG